MNLRNPLASPQSVVSIARMCTDYCSMQAQKWTACIYCICVQGVKAHIWVGGAKLRSSEYGLRLCVVAKLLSSKGRPITIYRRMYMYSRKEGAEETQQEPGGHAGVAPVS
jgi:hypothetical protein